MLSSQMVRKNNGFTYIEILVTISIVCLFIGIFLHMERYNYTQKNQWDQVDKMTMVAQGVIDGYRNQGKDYALTLGQGYSVEITEDVATGHTNLKKVTVTISSTDTDISPITLVTYHSS